MMNDSPLRAPLPFQESASTAPVWTRATLTALFELPFNDLLWHAQSVHRAHFDPNGVQLSTLLSIKTGGCPEDCGYCPQSAHHSTDLARQSLLTTDEVLKAAQRAKEAGATRFCMGAAWRSPKEHDLDQVIHMVRAVRDLGLETCATLGMLSPPQAERLKEAGLEYYNHNLDSDREFYGDIIKTRQFQDRLDTLQAVRSAGMKVCCGGIVGMGETRAHRAGLIHELTQLDPAPESVPINLLVQVQGTPLYGTEALDPLEFVRTIACARIALPQSRVRLSAGREGLSDELQALCFLAGANSIFYGERLLTTDNQDMQRDRRLFERLGLHAE